MPCDPFQPADDLGPAKTVRLHEAAPSAYTSPVR